MPNPETTPSPWAIFYLDGVNEIVPAMRPGTIASGIKNDADACLIVAAPDLLAALKEVVRISDRKHDAWDAAHAAIAKAEGNNTSV